MNLERGNGVISKHFSRCAQKDSHLLYMTYTYTWYGRLAIPCCDIGSMFPSMLGALVKMVLWVLRISSGPTVLRTYVYDITNDLYSTCHTVIEFFTEVHSWPFR